MQRLKIAEMWFVRSVKGCSGLDKIVRREIKENSGVFSVNGRVKERRQNWLELQKRLERGQMQKHALQHGPKRRDPGRPLRRER
jgi:hypothetical protein